MPLKRVDVIERGGRRRRCTVIVAVERLAAAGERALGESMIVRIAGPTGGARLQGVSWRRLRRGARFGRLRPRRPARRRGQSAIPCPIPTWSALQAGCRFDCTGSDPSESFRVFANDRRPNSSGSTRRLRMFGAGTRQSLDPFTRCAIPAASARHRCAMGTFIAYRGRLLFAGRRPVV